MFCQQVSQSVQVELYYNELSAGHALLVAELLLAIFLVSLSRMIANLLLHLTSSDSMSWWLRCLLLCLAHEHSCCGLLLIGLSAGQSLTLSSYCAKVQLPKSF